ncbi:hypothetical protein GY45DRAFT_1320933 [Cubamyces sp. BRFM 1775]|nr:hypothetical protein GY45DRAFT_1320933 [Cubamyces sp. BRFM 1775]
MSSAVLRVELPAYSHSFQVQVAPTSTIGDVKTEIARVCPGSPLPSGQRLVFKGRFLSDDEKVEDVWKSPDDSRIVHLAVHPSAWTSTPPPIPNAPSPSPQPTPTTHRAPAPQPRISPRTVSPRANAAPSSIPPSSPSSSLLMNSPPAAYLYYLHTLALCTLSGGAIPPPPQPDVPVLEAWRSTAVYSYRARGWTWPAIFDQPFPSGSAEEGAVYEPVTIEGTPYLSLATPNAVPTPAQVHALKVLSYTFPFLQAADHPAPDLPLAYYQLPAMPPANLNQRLQEHGFPALRLAGQNVRHNVNDLNNANPFPPVAAAGGAEIRAIPVRALMVPLLMLAFRTVLLLYFFSPSKRPLFGLLLSLWAVYEAWNTMRIVLHNGNDRAANRAAPNEPPAAAGEAQAGQGQDQAAPAAPERPSNRGANRSPLGAGFDRLAMINFSTEDALLETDAAAPAPGIWQKTKMFVVLFLLTLYPAAWDRRRTALRQREGRIRTEANAREAAMTERAERESAGAQAPPRSEEDEARARSREQLVLRHDRRPAWLKEYVQRVQYAEWVDDP